MSGVLVCRDFTYHLLDPLDLPEFTDLVPASLEQRQTVPCRVPFGLVKWHLEMMYGELEILGKRSVKVSARMKSCTIAEIFSCFDCQRYSGL